MTPVLIALCAGVTVLVLSGAVLIVRGARLRREDDSQMRSHIRAVLHDIDAA